MTFILVLTYFRDEGIGKLLRVPLKLEQVCRYINLKASQIVDYV
jgi:hypothetical protein